MRTKPRIALVDYDMGNLKSVSKSLEKSGCTVGWVSGPGQLKRFDALVLPGVGAFSVAVSNLKKRKLFELIRNWIESEKPFLGICLGYQLLFERSEEVLGSGKIEKGLSVYQGKVRRFTGGKTLRVPHMGWNQVQIRNGRDKVEGLSEKIFAGIPDRSYFYFVHSYFPEPADKRIIVSRTEYGTEFASSISENRLFACQFHPEKSGKTGLRLLRNFVQFVSAGR